MADGESYLSFGKYKGTNKTIEDLPSDYLRFLVGQEFFEEKYFELYEEVKEELKYRDTYGLHFYEVR